MNILAQIVESKKREIEDLYNRYDLEALKSEVLSNALGTHSEPLFYQRLSEARAAGKPFFITEFKRKSPSEGWINRDVDLASQIQNYVQSGAGAISVLTDEPFFGGTYEDLKLARWTVDGGRDTVDGIRWTVDGGRDTVDGRRDTVDGGRWTVDGRWSAADGVGLTVGGTEGTIDYEALDPNPQPTTLGNQPSVINQPPSTVNRPPSAVHRTPSTVHRQPSTVNRPLILQKDFILDPIQVYLARQHGADLILLIAAILDPGQLDDLRETAESIGLGVLVEVHDAEELDKIQHLDFKVLGVNNRDLKTFRTSLNRVNTLKNRAGNRFLIAESGVLDYRHFQMVSDADGFLIGTGLMRESTVQSDLNHFFRTEGRLIFKACGIRTADTLATLLKEGPDFIGINFSPLSKRRADDGTLAALKPGIPHSLVAVFYKNSEAEIRQILADYPFKTVQFYAGDVSPEFVRSLKVRVILAVKIVSSEATTSMVEPYAADVDCFILDGANPGSGERIHPDIPIDFPYPFLLAGGLHEGNLEAALGHKNCIGVDIASGIERNGVVDLSKIDRIKGIVESSKFQVAGSK